MSSRASFRRKMVLPVTVVRHGGQEKQLAHTLDVTSTSARLGGLGSLLGPGEIIEVQRGAVKAKFQVVWIGAVGGAMAGQAGIRGLDPNKCIWNVDLPEDEMDATVDAANLRQSTPLVRSSAQLPGERRWHTRYTCRGSVSVKTTGAAFAMNGEAKDISQGGVYIELSAPLPVDSAVKLMLCVEDIHFEANGVVRTSYPLLGMGICFQNLTPANAEKLNIVLERAKRRAVQQTPGAGYSEPSRNAEPASSAPERSAEANLELNPGSALQLVKACRKLVEEFDSWKFAFSPAELEELRVVIDELQQKVSPAPSRAFADYLVAQAHAKTV